MAKKRFITSHSNFVLRKKHQNLTDGIIYERDYMTISSPGGYAPGQVPIYGESNFKMTIRNSINGQLKHKYGNWDKRNSECPDYDDTTIWSLNCLSDEEISDDKITINPNYTSLLDFAYFGSAVELIHSSINNIISKFPGELYLSNRQFKYFKNKNDIKSSVLGENKYIVDNPFNIDLISLSILNSNVDNELRYFCNSFEYYSLYNDEKEISKISWKCTIENKNCYNNGDLIATIDLGVCKIYCYYINNDKIYLHDGKYNGYHIRPNENKVDEFFNKLDDFEKVLLNRDSNPKYKAILDTPKETEIGVITYKKSYIWPVSNNWNLDISSTLFETYLNGLLSISEFYDEYYTNNLWRSLTHESIKNLDLTYKHESEKFDSDDYIIGISRIEGMFMAYGRQFDDLKRYIDNIKSINIITYDNKNNMPYYFLGNSLELSGWDVVNTAPSNNRSIYSNQLYSNNTKKYNSIDANNEFMKRLKINSKYILSAKGTKNSIEMLLSLFGLKKYNANTKEGDYIINEYVGVSQMNKKPDGSSYSLEEFKNKVEEQNQYKINFIYESSENNKTTNLLQGLPVKIVAIYDDVNDIQLQYIIPWFDKLQDIDGSPYFQMRGGWENMKSKKINLDIAPNITELKGTNNVKLWGETSKYLNVVRNLDELLSLPLQKLSNNDVYYVYDITDISYRYKEKDESSINMVDYSHYFILKDVNNSDILGYSEIDGIVNEGWVCIKVENIENANTDDAIRILYLESIIDDNKGNNPHNGKGEYDGGNEYLEFFRKLFKYSIENDNFSQNAYECDSNDIFNLNDYAKTIGFDIDLQKDNMKCWYFTDTQNERITSQNKNEIPMQLEGKTCDFNDENYCGFEQMINNDNDIIYVGKDFNDKTYDSELNPNNLEESLGNTKKYDIAAANSIINVKNLEINFIGNIISEYDLNNDAIEVNSFKDYATNIILFYVKQLIPSTTIVKINFIGEDNFDTCFNVPLIGGISQRIISTDK